jgi:hypothetical protein
MPALVFSQKIPDSASRREHLLVVRLATKEQENQELLSQVTENSFRCKYF